MQDGIVIKSSKAGMTVILDPDLPFPRPACQYCKKVWRQCPFLGKCPDDTDSGRTASVRRRGISDRQYNYRELTA